MYPTATEGNANECVACLTYIKGHYIALKWIDVYDTEGYEDILEEGFW